MTINVATDFTRFPAGRYRSDSRFSGEEFREDFIIPALQSGSKVVIELDGTLGYGSSFLDEAFGGLVRLGGFAADFLREHLEFRTDNPVLRAEIDSYLS